MMATIATLQPNQILSLVTLVIALVLSIILLFYKYENYLRILGSLFVMTLAFMSNHWSTYLVSVVVVATLITEIEFLEKLMAILTNRKEYFEYLRDSNMQQEALDEPEIDAKEEVITELKSQLEVTQQTRDNYIVAYHYEKTYRLIFGAQLKILHELSATPNSRLPAAVITNIYGNSKWSGSYPFSSFIGFLINSYLLAYDPNTNEYILTLIGSDFLNYLRLNNMRPTKSV